MFKNILSTLSTKIISAALSLVIVILTSHLLGAEALGKIGLIVLGITIVLLVSNFIGGGALIYLIPRIGIFKLIVPSYVWSLVSGVIVTYILYKFNLIPREYSIHIFLLSLLNSFASVNFNIMLGREKIKTFNIITLLQVIAQCGTLCILLLVFNKQNIFSYLLSLYAGFGLSLLLSFIFIIREIKITRLSTGYVLSQTLKYGSYVQFANIIQLLNYRLNYYIINFYYSKALLGVFTLGVQLSEGFWLVSKSIATVQYARIANSKDIDYSISITIKFLKITFVATLLTILPLLILPSGFFTFVFGKDFGYVKDVILLMSIGILAVAVNSIFSHFYAGTGRHYLNTIGSIIGFIMTLVVGFTLIPKYGINGAAITASFSYLVSLIFQMIVFTHITKTKIRDYIPKKDDMQFFVNEVRRIVKKD